MKEGEEKAELRTLPSSSSSSGGPLAIGELREALGSPWGGGEEGEPRDGTGERVVVVECPQRIATQGFSLALWSELMESEGERSWRGSDGILEAAGGPREELEGTLAGEQRRGWNLSVYIPLLLVGRWGRAYPSPGYPIDHASDTLGKGPPLGLLLGAP